MRKAPFFAGAFPMQYERGCSPERCSHIAIHHIAENPADAQHAGGHRQGDGQIGHETNIGNKKAHQREQGAQHHTDHNRFHSGSPFFWETFPRFYGAIILQKLVHFLTKQFRFGKRMATKWLQFSVGQKSVFAPLLSFQNFKKF